MTRAAPRRPPISPVLRSALRALETNTSPRLSPDGTAVVFVRRTGSGDAVCVMTSVADGPGPVRLVATYEDGAVRDPRWTPDGRWLTFLHAPRGRETWALTAYHLDADQVVPVATGPVTEYWPGDAGVVYSAREPGSRVTRLWHVDLDDPRPVLLDEPNPGYHRWLVDRQSRPRGGVRLGRDGASTVVVRASGGARETTIPIEPDAVADLAVPGFNADGTTLYLLTSTDAPTRRLLGIDTETGEITEIARHDELDLAGYPIGPDGVWFDPITATPDLCAVFGERFQQLPLTSRMAEKVAAVAGHLGAADGAEPLILDRDATDEVWLVCVVHDDGPLEYVRCRPATGEHATLLVNRPDLPRGELPELTSFCYRATDGKPIVGYRLAPRDAPAEPAATVVMVHGGPAARDYWRFHADAQYLALLGLTSLHLNFRGSRGFGREFRRAGLGEWGGAMQQDLYDGVAHGVASGLVDQDRVGFFGSSYGGYAALVAATTRPDLVRYAIAISPQCDLVRLATRSPAFFSPIAGSLSRQILGAVPREDADEVLRERSPRHRLTEDCPPLFIAHGVRDPRIPVDEVDEFVAAARDLGVDVTYLRFDDEGHQVTSNRNRAVLFDHIQSFVESHGRAN
ncbi:S9 family peptidase [Saccharothrix luteola]|uniref:S9 family peptidase n=1 Tax=Saccharothrix luteola TaxID=2893018 RepID=UPI001E534904|nr:prolyl oligopeptidase family serine peptidase [Saccharothrix luteola]MCC8242782.1 prolyl oligopeptidase family serine peptidase [Saccharothrix luteola]